MLGRTIDFIKGLRWWAWTAIGVSLVLLVVLVIERLWLNAIWMSVIRPNPLILIFVFVLIASAVKAVVRFYEDREYHDASRNLRYYPTSSEDRPQPKEPKGLSFWQWVTISVLSLVGWIVFGLISGFMSASAYMATVTTTDDPIPTYQVRAPYEMAQALAPQKITVTGGEMRLVEVEAERTSGSEDDEAPKRKLPSETTYLPAEDLYTTPVYGRSFLGNTAEIVSQKIDERGVAQTNNCRFTADNQLSLHGYLHHNLKRAIVQKDFGIWIDANDAYGYCDGATPKIVVPITKASGFYPVIAVPAGVAVYDGSTGEVTIVRDVADGSIPGPVYPNSLAERQREATKASGSIFDWLFNRAGYETTANDANDPNRGNAGEFTLSGDAGTDFVTQVVNRGQSTGISAVMTTDADHLSDGQLNTLSIHRLNPPRDSNSNIASRSRGEFEELNWATPGFGIFEVIPTSDGKWSATVGLVQTITNRIEIGSDGQLCLFTATGQKLRCSGEALDPGKTPTEPTPVPGDLSSLSDAELAQLGREVADEWTRRHG